ncbi:glutathione-regulated potassium-efflux system ancillary protein KefC [Methylomagnum ishizawai]|uniref:Glutathione-regulated potassium-efflux system ancillary protein KefC n=1 Tax=Methylomagnum ishizawai TaxID=1760988 RepID=A0A1Y6CS61_9GAMM|nr:glutathione-regulated potassium-efflux system protein KefC [Methylomagnum ishizawai]SMF93469.1 glutathione-regulated potassium-efflux system ancillary protein KefC [Methylomagnum ishizawai]
MHDAVFLQHLLIYLGGAVVCVPIAKRLGLGSVLGYLLAGLIIGPSGLGLIGRGEEVLHFAEFGVVIMLFLVGLELAPKRLWELRGPVLGLGGLQVLTTTGLLAGFALVFDLGGPAALIAAMGMALSSTAIALQILAERNALATPAGRLGFATLLFQDLAVIPMLALIPLLGDGAAGGGFDWPGAAKALGVILGIVVGGRFLLLPWLRFVAVTQQREIFTALALLLVIAIALLMRGVGMSMALGTFLAGVLLAESEYRHALEADLEPFKGLLLGLFFIAIGMSVDWATIQAHWQTLVLLTLCFVLVKLGVLAGLARLFGIPKAQRLFFAITLSQGGEFAFVLNNTALAEGIIPADIAGLLAAVVALSMMTTPILLSLHDRWLEPYLAGRGKPDYDAPEDEGNPVIIAGFGRFGQIVGRLLTANRIGVTVLDHDPVHIDTIRKFGNKVFYGDATRIDLLRAAGAEKAKLMVVAIDDVEHSLRLIDAVREEFPHLTLLARVRNVQHAFELMERGVHFQREIFESALLLGEHALVRLGYGPYAAKQAALKFRAHDLHSLVKRYEARGDEEELISVVREARQQLEEAMNADREAYQLQVARDYWK